jgi:hypothetical protein
VFFENTLCPRPILGLFAQAAEGGKTDVPGKLSLISHCEEHSDEAISKCLIVDYQIAALRSQ